MPYVYQICLREMMMRQQTYQRTVAELRNVASMFWPAELSEEAAKLSVIPLLLTTQEEFVAILSVPVSDLHNFFQIINSSAFAGNLFLKHLVILADFGGEQLLGWGWEFPKIIASLDIMFI